MTKIKIGDKEYSEEEALKLVQQGEDYTKKTMGLAEEKKNLDSRAEYLRNLEGMDQYAETHPEFKAKLVKLVRDESAAAEGIPGVSPQSEQDFDAGKAVVGSEGEEPEYVSKKELKSILSNVVKEQDDKHKVADNQKELNRRVNGEFESLRAKGYTQEELIKIATVAKQNDRFPMETVERMILHEQVPNRLKKEKEPTEEEKLKLLKGNSGSGFALEKEEVEFIKTGGEPGELLKLKLAKKPGLLIKKEA